MTPSATEPEIGMSPAAVTTADEPGEVTSAETADILLLPDPMMAADESVMELLPDDTMALVEPTQMPTAGSVWHVAFQCRIFSALIDKSFYYLGENWKLTLNPFKALVALYQAGPNTLFSCGHFDEIESYAQTLLLIFVDLYKCFP